MILRDIVEKQRKNRPDVTAVVCEERRITYEELAQTVNRLAWFLKDHGAEKGDLIHMAVRKTPEVIIGMLSAAAIGAVALPVNYRLPLEDQKKFLNLFPPRAVLLDERLRELKELIESGFPASASAVIINVDSDKSADKKAWERAIEQYPDTPPPVSLHEDELIYYNFTSGSTGEPKAAICNHKQLWWNTEASIKAFDLTEEDIHLPLFAVFSHPHELFMRSLVTGGTTVLTETANPRQLMEIILKEKITCIMGVAALYRLLADYAGRKGLSSNTLRLAESGGMATPPELNRLFRDVFGLSIHPVWGSTETTGIALATPLSGVFPLDSVGKPCPHYDVRIVDDDRKEVPEGETGELQIKGPAVTEYYSESADRFLPFLEDGWYSTRDLFQKDAQGWHYFMGRKDALIKIGGLKVYPREVECAIISHPAVRDAVVAPAEDELRGEVYHAYLICKEGARPPEEIEMIRYLQKNIARYKIPKYFTYVEDFPRTASGKVSLKKLAKMSQKRNGNG